MSDEPQASAGGTRAEASRPGMDRREAIRRLGGLFGGAALVSSGALIACDDQARTAAGVEGAGQFTPADIAFLDEVADTILPATGTPGAKAAKVGAFMAVMVTDTYDESDRRIFREGMRTLDAASQHASGRSFMGASPADRTALLETLDREQHASRDEPDAPRPFFRMMKELTLLGYFTSEIGYTQAMRYVESPGRFDPCVPYSPGDKAWARHA